MPTPDETRFDDEERALFRGFLAEEVRPDIRAVETWENEGGPPVDGWTLFGWSPIRRIS